MPEDYTIAVMRDHYIEDPVLTEACKIIFKWANEQGLKGIKCTDLEFNPPPNFTHPYFRRIDCKIEKEKSE